MFNAHMCRFCAVCGGLLVGQLVVQIAKFFVHAIVFAGLMKQGQQCGRCKINVSHTLAWIKDILKFMIGS